jgi:exopolysaccharide biosynthesis polyprenyl glycosylphosphotransferase
MAVLLMSILGGYRSLLEQSRARMVANSLVAPLVGLSLIALVLFALKETEVSRLFVFSFAVVSGLGLGLYRMVLRAYFRHRLQSGYYAKNVVFIGLTPALEWMARYFKENVSPAEYSIAGYLRVEAEQAAPVLPLSNPHSLEMPLLGDALDLGNLLIHRPIHEVIAIQSAQDDKWLQTIMHDCDYFQVVLRIVPASLLSGELRELKMHYRNEPLQLPAVVLKPRLMDSEALFLKRFMDVVISAGALVLLSPVFLGVALAIKLTTPHLPVFYPWRVVGLKGKPFTGYKFTTMDADADERKAELIEFNEMTGPVFKIKDDPRITPLGRFLRKYSLNELPQLWSVLKGEMSLVGPRPAFPDELARYEFWHKRKLSIRPGITCLWQVRGRNQINDFDHWVKMDFEYIDNWSLWLDIKILAWTAWAVVAGTGS